MYDTVNLYYDRFSTDDWQTTAKAIEDARSVADVETGEVTTHGHHRNLRIKMSEGGIYICGSLAKWFFPYEPITLNRHQAQDAIQALSDTFHIDINRARVQRLDGSKDFIMKYEPQRYYELLQARQRYNRVLVTSYTLYFNQNVANPIQQQCFYNKRREIENHKGNVLQVYEGVNVLRYELRLKGRIKQQMKWNEITAATLYDRNFYNAFVGMWADAYFSIQKRRTIDIENLTSEELNTRDIVKILCAYGLQYVTPEAEQSVLMAIKDCVKDRHYTARAMDKIKEIRQTAKISYIGDLVKELNANIRNVRIYGR